MKKRHFSFEILSLFLLTTIFVLNYHEIMNETKVYSPKDAISSNFGLASLSAGVCCSQKALFLTAILVPPGPFSCTVSIFMCNPANRPQVTWKAEKQEFLWHWIQAPFVPLVLQIRHDNFHLKYERKSQQFYIYKFFIVVATLLYNLNYPFVWNGMEKTRIQ